MRDKIPCKSFLKRKLLSKVEVSIGSKKYILKSGNVSMMDPH